MQEDYCTAILEPNKSLGSADRKKRLQSKLEPQAKVYIGRTCKFDLTLASVCIKLYIHKASSFYLFYKITLGKVMWRHNHICIALYKHGNWPITAYIRHTKFIKTVIQWNCGKIIEHWKLTSNHIIYFDVVKMAHGLAFLKRWSSSHKYRLKEGKCQKKY